MCADGVLRPTEGVLEQAEGKTSMLRLLGVGGAWGWGQPHRWYITTSLTPPGLGDTMI